MVVCVVQESTFHQTPEGIFLLYYLKRSQSSGKQFPLITPLTSGNILDFPVFINKNFSLISLFELVSKFYVYSSVHLWSILIIVQRDVTQIRLFIILQVHSTCFGCQPHPSSGVHKTGTKGSGTGHIFCAATSLQRDQASLATLEGTTPIIILMMGVVDTRNLQKWTCRIISSLLCVASRWTIINTVSKYSYTRHSLAKQGPAGYVT